MAEQPRDNLGRYLSPDKDKSHLNFNSKFGSNLGGFLDAAERAGHKISIYSGARSNARQKQLFDAAVARYGSVAKARKMVAPPGKSKHNLGLAADLNYGPKGSEEEAAAKAWAHENAKKYGLNYRMSWEDWHIEPLGKMSQMGIGLAELVNPQQNPLLPDTMRAPQTLSQVRAQEAAIAKAYASPTRALDVPQTRPGPPSNFSVPATPSSIGSAPVGQVTRAPLGPALNRPTVPGNFAGGKTPPSIAAAPAGSVTRGTLGPALSRTAPPSNFATPATPSRIDAAPVGSVTKGPALAPARPSDEKLASAYGQMGATKQAAQEAAYAAFEANRAKAFSALPAPPPALAAPPAVVLAPALAPPRTVQDMNVAAPSVPSTPQYTASDVYSGRATQGTDSVGNTIGRLSDGTTTVTNKYGVTTGMTPYGKQTAVGSMGALPGIDGPTASKIGGAVKGALPGMAGAALGGALAGPLGALAGGLLAKAMTQPGGLLSGLKNIDTSQIPAALGLGAVTAFHKPNGSLNSFPSAPSGGYGSGGKMGASFSNRSRGEMDSISPGASKAIGAGKGGLY